jgi:hypothetical protein
MPRLVACLVVLMMAAPAAAGTKFRLEIGPPVAAGTGTPITKQFKNTIVLVVRPRVCDSPSSVQITGTAEGLVNGVRQSLPLELVPVNPADGIYAVQRQWPNGHWVLQLNGTCPKPKASASTLVPMSDVTFIREKTKVLSEPATRQQVEALLKEWS